MNTTSVKLHSFDYGQTKTYGVSALFILGNIVFPQLCHLIPGGGATLLPIYFFTLLGAYKYGWRVGLLTALLSPVVNAALFGMPAVTALPAIMFKSVTLALAAGWAAAHFKRVSLVIMAGVVVLSQLLGTGFEWAVTGSLTAALQDVRIGMAGILLQIAGCWAIIKYVLTR